MGRRYKNDTVVAVLFRRPPIGTPVIVGSLHTHTLSYVWQDVTGARKVVVAGVRDNPVLVEDLDWIATSVCS
jgi:hypothetical protein